MYFYINFYRVTFLCLLCSQKDLRERNLLMLSSLPKGESFILKQSESAITY